MRILRLADPDGPRQVFDRADPGSETATDADTEIAAELATLEAARAALDRPPISPTPAPAQSGI